MIDLTTLPTWTPIALIFLSASFATFWAAARIFGDERHVRQRYAATAAPAVINHRHSRRPAPTLPITPELLGLDAGAQRKLRLELIRAGHFRPNAVVVFTLARTLVVLLLPLAVYGLVVFRFSQWHGLAKLVAVGSTFVFGYYAGRGYLDRRTRLLQERYRLFFPDFLDMILVCVNAGLSLESALERVAQELSTSEYEFRVNLQLAMAEMRAGKTTIDALKDLAGRLGIAEAASLATLLQQSLELGTDVSSALSTYSDEMRDKRMSRAEEKAFALPVKITLPLALFILPTILIAIMTPAAIKIMAVFTSAH